MGCCWVNKSRIQRWQICNSIVWELAYSRKNAKRILLNILRAYKSTDWHFSATHTSVLGFLPCGCWKVEKLRALEGLRETDDTFGYIFFFSIWNTRIFCENLTCCSCGIYRIMWKIINLNLTTAFCSRSRDMHLKFLESRLLGKITLFLAFWFAQLRSNISVNIPGAEAIPICVSHILI